MSRFFLTTAIDYVNSRPHLGTAYEKVTADVIARYSRLIGADTHFLMGNDEHSQNVFRRARDLDLPPLEYCDRMEAEFREVWARLDVSFDDFIRTSAPRHRAGVEEMVRRIAAAGDLYEGFYEGPYCVGCEAFKPDKDLVDGRCPVHGTVAEQIRERNHFFRLSKYGRPLAEHLARHPEFVEPEVRRNEILRLLESGLEDISISRAGQSWGVPLPVDPSSVVYVWFDALINYISAVGFGHDPALFARWWPADLHVVGKDITRFHCVVWPAMLMSAGLPLPRGVFGHGFVQFRGEKMSKSLGTAVDPLEAASRFGPDPLRLYLVKEIPYGQDGDFSWERFEERYNVDLANNLGNLVNRLAAMSQRYRRGRLQPSSLPPGRLADLAASAVERYRQSMDRLALHDGVAAAFGLVDAANVHIAETEPWTLARRPDGQPALDRVLEDVAEVVRIAAVLLLPVMPRSAAEILRRVGETRAASQLRLDADAAWSGGRVREIVAGDLLWPRLEPAVAVVSAMPSEGQSMTSEPPAVPAPDVSRSAESAAETAQAARHGDTPPPGPAQPAGPVEPAAPPERPRITLDEFMKVDLRVARVLAAEKVKGSRKLVKMEVDLGAEQRTVVAGIAEAYAPEALVGLSVVIVANLQPARLMGVESNGMVLAASPEGGLPALVGFGQPPPPGSRVR